MTEVQESYGKYDSQSSADWGLKQAERNIGHVQEMTGALESNMVRLLKGLDILEKRISSVLNPTQSTPEDDSAPVPVRCPLADELAKVNDRLYVAARRVEAMGQAVDI